LGIVDWDFANSNRGLDTLHFTEGNASLVFTWENACLCKKQVVLNMREGALETWVYRRVETYGSYLVFLIRNQAPVGSYSYRNTYCLRDNLGWPGTHPTGIYFQRFENGELVWESSLGYSVIPGDSWQKVRVEWWETADGLNVLLKLWEKEEWKTKIPVLVDPANKWAESEINRVGFWARHFDSYNAEKANPAHWDSTKILKAI